LLEKKEGRKEGESNNQGGGNKLRNLKGSLSPQKGKDVRRALKGRQSSDRHFIAFIPQGGNAASSRKLRLNSHFIITNRSDQGRGSNVVKGKKKKKDLAEIKSLRLPSIEKDQGP